jgi:hypothetical protein
MPNTEHAQNDFDRIQTGGSNTFYRIKHIKETKNELFEIKKKEINLELSNEQMDFFCANKNVDDLFNTIYDNYIKECPESLKIQIVIFLPGFFQTPVSSKFISKSVMSPSFMLGIIDRVIQSKKPSQFEDITSANKMQIVISFAKIIQGSGKRKRDHEPKKNVINLKDYCNANRLITVLPMDKLCLVRAILISKAHADKEKNAHTLKSSQRKLEERVNLFVLNLDLPTNIELNLTHVRKIEEYLSDYSIVVYSGGDRNQSPIYFNRENIKKKFLYILHRDDHYDALLNIKSFFNAEYFCEPCQMIVSNFKFHHCSSTCETCNRQNCVAIIEKTCRCGLITKNKLCQERHEESVCFKNLICSICNTLKRRKIHVCLNQKFCTNCAMVIFKFYYVVIIICFIMLSIITFFLLLKMKTRNVHNLFINLLLLRLLILTINATFYLLHKLS